MVESYSDANDQMFGLIFSTVPDIAVLLGYTPEIVYQGVESVDRMPTGALWMRVSRQSVISEQSTFRGDFERRYNDVGYIYVQIFITKEKPELYAVGQKVAQIIQKVLRGKSTDGCIWFKRATIRELPAEAAWSRINVQAEYNYDEIG